MTKLLSVITLAVLATSCEQKLPSNIATANGYLEIVTNDLNPLDSTIRVLTKDKIDLLTRDSIQTILIRYNNRNDAYDAAKKDLNELLKYNAELSDHSEIKRVQDISNKHNGLGEFTANYFYLKNMDDYLLWSEHGYKFKSKPNYETLMMGIRE